MHKRLVVHPVFPVETDGRLVVGMEQVVGIDRRVGITEESPHVSLIRVVESFKTMFRHLLIGFHQGLGHDEVLYAVQSGIREVLGTHHPVCFHRLTHLQGGIYDDTVEAAQHLGIHTTHRGADDEIGLLAVAHLSQQCHCLFRFYGQVGCHDGGIG